LLEEIKYIWRKINPDIALTVKKKSVKKALPITKKPVVTNSVNAIPVVTNPIKVNPVTTNPVPMQDNT
jgi:hypothetical protein